MFAVELYINEVFKGYLKGQYIYEITKDINQAFLTSTFDDAKGMAVYFLDRIDFDDDYAEYKVIELELKKVKEYIPKSMDYFNDEFDVNTF